MQTNKRRRERASELQMMTWKKMRSRQLYNVLKTWAGFKITMAAPNCSLSDGLRLRLFSLSKFSSSYQSRALAPTLRMNAKLLACCALFEKKMVKFVQKIFVIIIIRRYLFKDKLYQFSGSVNLVFELGYNLCVWEASGNLLKKR